MPENERRLAVLLRETEAAHGAYEATVLGGQRDEEWPRWYATYLLDHGMAGLLPGADAPAAGALAASLARYAAEYDREQPADPWPEVYARRLLAELSPGNAAW